MVGGSVMNPNDPKARVLFVPVHKPIRIRCGKCWNEAELKNTNDVTLFLGGKMACMICFGPMGKTEFWPPNLSVVDAIKQQKRGIV